MAYRLISFIPEVCYGNTKGKDHETDTIQRNCPPSS
jgi:hypothetical protein